MFFPFCKPSQYEGFVKADFPGSWDKSIRGPAGEFPLSRSRTLKPQISAVSQQDASAAKKELRTCDDSPDDTAPVLCKS